MTEPSPPAPLRCLLAAGPRASGAEDLLDRVRALAGAGRGIRVLLTGGGLDWVEEARLEELARIEGVEIALCSQSARARPEDPTALPRWIRWSSLVAWFRDYAAAEPLWSLFP